MRTFILLQFLLIATVHAQQNTPKSAFLVKWENSKDYLLELAEAMPKTAYNFKPTERQMSFKAQLIHIKENMDWLGNAYFGASKQEKLPQTTSKEAILVALQQSFNRVKKTIQNYPEEKLEETVDFFAGPKSRLQILNLLQDHVTHHRGQLIVYANLKNITPPKYRGW